MSIAARYTNVVPNPSNAHQFTSAGTVLRSRRLTRCTGSLKQREAMKTTLFPTHAGHAAPRPAVTTVRAASTKDYSTCADIWLAASLAGHDFVSAAFWRGQRAVMAEHYLPSSQILLLTDDGEPAAFAATLPDDNSTYLAGLFVLPRWWGKGLGRHLLELVQEQVLAELPDQKNASLRCSVYEKNSRALAFYARMGFIPAGRSICPHTNEPQTDMLWAAEHTVQDKAAATCRP